MDASCQYHEHVHRHTYYLIVMAELAEKRSTLRKPFHSRRFRNSEQKMKVVQEVSQGMPPKEVAKQYGIGKTQVYKISTILYVQCASEDSNHAPFISHITAAVNCDVSSLYKV